jgi:hypothetical protein
VHSEEEPTDQDANAKSLAEFHHALTVAERQMVARQERTT